MDLGLQSVKKYWRHAAQVADELSHLQDFLPTLAVFVNEAYINYNQKMQLDKRLRFRRDRDHEYVSSLFIKFHASVQCWKMDGKDIANTSKLVKKFVRCSLVWGGSSSNTWHDHIWLGEDEPDDRSPWRGKMIGKLLLTVTVANPQ